MTASFEDKLFDGLVRASEAGTFRAPVLSYPELERLGIHPNIVPGPTFWPFRPAAPAPQTEARTAP